MESELKVFWSDLEKSRAIFETLDERFVMFPRVSFLSGLGTKKKPVRAKLAFERQNLVNRIVHLLIRFAFCAEGSIAFELAVRSLGRIAV